MPTLPEQVDVIVIGSGGGLKIAAPAADLGHKVVLIEKGDFGGTCLNRGCIPSKMVIYPAEMLDTIRQAERWDLKTSGPASADLPAIIERTEQAVTAISATNRARLADHPNIELIVGEAAFESDHIVRVGDRHITAERIFIAVGARPTIPPIAGLDQVPYMTSTDALHLREVPQRLLCIGGGYIAVELGYALARFGADTQFIVRSRFLRESDREIADHFTEVFSQHHAVHLGWQPTAVEFKDGTYTLHGRRRDGSLATLEGDGLLICTGITPETDQLGLEHTSIKVNADGYIQVDDTLVTAAPGVYAFGDCIGRYFFRHTANLEGEYLMRTAFGTPPAQPLEYGPVPYAVFSHPQIAAVGATESQLIEAGMHYVAGRANYEDSTPGMARCADHGLVKVLIETRTRRILGAHIIGDEASDMIHLFIVAMHLGGTLDDLLRMIFVHPALPEVARDALRDAAAQLAD